MKGIVFTEFMEMVESSFGLEVVDEIIEKSNLESEGIYTSIGTYEFNEMVSLITNLSDSVKIDTNTLLHTFGYYLFSSLGKAHPEVIKSYTNPLGLLYSIEDHIHVHVKKLYPDAELPSFKILEKTDHSISMIYSSSRGLYRLAHGLIEKCFEHFNSSAKVSYELLKEDGTEVKFDIVQNG
ncbi:heme NO-binding domain-containing protein [Arenibacter palladensis]|uniref:heme NO-binding domain-containing protein n=1 Tax=Arenibacter palladensis TaxID=237373 RepID=UPI0026E42C7F|nr:heme NO-binding domain-containing protein [Arenibacter palladensis]MDO6603504.1 heme NO-binding domain-containing protein [Arenibacter palladensis]